MTCQRFARYLLPLCSLSLLLTVLQAQAPTPSSAQPPAAQRIVLTAGPDVCNPCGPYHQFGG